ncbi:methyltransferase domain-containing protein [Haloarchaeobius amylolyticus]|uniref:methyltransferase domain-containing protein n=1 Tax=Haloarchaeobius amylolyticus TaxID=1198296 RepID=UPI00227145A7|nr:methyltransferase domain-containing protein [Haloarchaeobius amylolyticus]
MPTKATVYRALIASPADVQEERNATREVIMQWNAAHSRQQGVYIEPVLYETHVAKDLGDSPQDIIGRQLYDHCDLVIGVFWSRIGTATENAEGGAVEEVETLAFDEGKPGIVGFSQRDIPRDQLDVEQIQKLERFQEKCRNEGLFFTYQTTEEFKNQLSQELANTMNHLLEQETEGSFTKKSKQDAEASEYDPEVDHGRLQLSSDTHKQQDLDALDDVLAHFEDSDIEPPYRVLDAGCGYGTVTQDRFGHDDRFDVLAIDRVPNVLSIARGEYDAPNIEYRQLDVNDLESADIGTFDLVVATYLFHHLENQEPVLSMLWERVREDGALFVRSCEDGQHIHYPPDEDMDWLVEVTDDIKGSSDRTHGRRLYTHLKRLRPEPDEIQLDLRNYHTAGKDRDEREQYWDVFHSNRLHYAEVLAKRPDATAQDEELYETMRKRFDRLEQKFTDNDAFLDAKSVPLTVAYR